MKKTLILLTSTAFLTTTSLHTIACGDSFLEITNDEIYDSSGITGKLDNIAFMYMYALSKNKKPDHGLSDFYTWKWNLNNRKKIVGFNFADRLDTEREYWEIIIQKTKNKGMYVSKHKKWYEPIKIG